jgi:hypothetical protein
MTPATFPLIGLPGYRHRSVWPGTGTSSPQLGRQRRALRGSAFAAGNGSARANVLADRARRLGCLRYYATFHLPWSQTVSTTITPSSS